MKQGEKKEQKQENQNIEILENLLSSTSKVAMGKVAKRERAEWEYECYVRDETTLWQM